jgi:hypothetical protein
MSSDQATAGYREVIHGLLARVPAHPRRIADSRANNGALAFSPKNATNGASCELDRGASHPARGIVISILLGIALWGIMIGLVVAIVR